MIINDLFESSYAGNTERAVARNMTLDTDQFEVAEASPEATFNALKGLTSWQVVIMNNYYRGKYADYSGRYYYVLATSPEQARQVVLDNADAILQDLLSMKSVNGKKILPRGSAVRITADRIGDIRDGTEAGRMTTAGFKKMFSPQGPMMVKLANGAIADVQGQEQGVAEGSDNIRSMIQQYEDMVELVYDLPPGRKKNIAIDKRDELEAQIEAMPGGSEALRQWAKSYNDAMDEGVAEGSDGAVSFREMIDVVDQHYPKYYAELSGSDISDKQFERAIVNAYKEIIKKQGVAEGYIFKGGFPFDVDHMPGSVIRNRDETTDVVKTKNKDKWDDEVDRINDEVFDDMSDFTTDRHGETVTGNSAVWAKWDNRTQTGWINSKGNPLKPWPVKEQGVAEGYDKWGWHTSVTNGEFMPTKYGNKAYVYLHDMDNQSANGNPQLVTFNKPTHAKRAAAQFGGKVVKTDLNTYRIVKPAEQGVTESIKAMVKQATSREDLRQIRKFVAENVADQKAQRKIMEQATHIVAVQRRKHAAQAAK